METSPVFYVSEKLKYGLLNSNLSGIYDFQEIEVSKSETFLELYPFEELPNFFYLRINREAKKSDFSIGDGILVVSERALNVLGKYNLSSSNIEEI